MRNLDKKIRFLQLRSDIIKKLQTITQAMPKTSVSNKTIKEIGDIEAMLGEIISSSNKILETTYYKKQKLNLVALLESLCAELHTSYHHVTFASATAEAWCYGNTLILRRIFTNLINNAVKYGECAHVSLVVVDGKISIYVDDQGNGLPEAELNKVFEPFYRSSTAKQKQGSGIGLAFVKLATLLHNGKIELRNLPNQGLRAAITLPTREVKTTHKEVQVLTQQLLLQSYIIKLAALSHDALNLITRVRLRTALMDDQVKQFKIDSILDEIEKLMQRTIAASKQVYQKRISIDQVANIIPSNTGMYSEIAFSAN